MAGVILDYRKLRAARHITVWVGPENAFAAELAPTVAELTALHNASSSISWNDWDFGMQASETLSDPSFADAATFTERGAANYGGGISFYYPKEWDVATDDTSISYDLTKTPNTPLVVVIRIDGEKRTTQAPAVGDYVHVFYVTTDGEANALTGADAYRRTVGMLSQGVYATYTTVGPHTIAVPSTLAVGVGESVRIASGTLDGREYRGGFDYVAADGAVAAVTKPGVVTGIAAGTTNITVEDPNSNSTATIAVTVS